MNHIVFGTAVGMALGFALAFGSFGQMLIVALFAALGFGAAKVLSGEVDLGSYRANRSGRR
ncbi:hypothetical protein GCM10010399_25070 [Dactylosporangium fulvum]|uniref:DUF2273 domain-containing protein n=1 Tax=Dactylosporangium fulvum TaxID=53359 RepID=A0ABY5W8B1_9ACTN|nr:hypothetical protein [Dactylosporangium fulvum]UWP85459.1 hypothetical protein Dfulv_14945 [Dactylosporangium fulvum]